MMAQLQSLTVSVTPDIDIISEGRHWEEICVIQLSFVLIIKNEVIRS